MPRTFFQLRNGLKKTIQIEQIYFDSLVAIAAESDVKLHRLMCNLWREAVESGELGREEGRKNSHRIEGTSFTAWLRRYVTRYWRDRYLAVIGMPEEGLLANVERKQTA